MHGAWRSPSIASHQWVGRGCCYLGSLHIDHVIRMKHRSQMAISNLRIEMLVKLRIMVRTKVLGTLGLVFGTPLIPTLQMNTGEMVLCIASAVTAMNISRRQDRQSLSYDDHTQFLFDEHGHRLCR